VLAALRPALRRSDCSRTNLILSCSKIQAALSIASPPYINGLCNGLISCVCACAAAALDWSSMRAHKALNDLSFLGQSYMLRATSPSVIMLAIMMLPDILLPVFRLTIWELNHSIWA
jgi:hypothetical protein